MGTLSTLRVSKAEYERRVLNARFRLTYWFSFTLAIIGLLLFVCAVLVPMIARTVLDKIWEHFEFYWAWHAVCIFDDGVNWLFYSTKLEKPVQWMQDTIDLLAEREKHKEFFLSLFEE